MLGFRHFTLILCSKYSECLSVSQTILVSHKNKFEKNMFKYYHKLPVNRIKACAVVSKLSECHVETRE